MRVLLGVTGSVASYKSVIISRLLHKRGIEHRVIMTPSALNFIRPLSFIGSSGVEVYTDEDFFERNLHIELARWGDVLLVAPATMNFISKFALGIADNLLLATATAFEGRIVLAPAMHTEMWNFRPFQENLKKLVDMGIEIVGPEEGELASGDVGMGRMSEPEVIVEHLLSGTGRRVLLVYGRTEEDIDDVRVITNRSSGRMGYEIHRALRGRGVPHTVVVAGCVDYLPSGVRTVRVRRTEELLEALSELLEEHDVLIMAVAVSDFLPDKVRGKMDRREGEIDIRLKPNIDVLRSIREKKGNRLFVGFALEEEDSLERRAMEKLKEKGLDLIVANVLDTMGSGAFTGEIISGSGEVLARFEKAPKSEVARRLVDIILSV